MIKPKAYSNEARQDAKLKFITSDSSIRQPKPNASQEH